MKFLFMVLLISAFLLLKPIEAVEENNMESLQQMLRTRVGVTTCIEGKMRCNGSKVQLCVQGSWKTMETCQQPEFCSWSAPGSGVTACLTIGDVGR
jgi:hypothetical protein